MGYIDSSGTYHEGDPTIADMVVERNLGWKNGDHDRQRQDHKVDLIRPYNDDGTPSEAFIEQYPIESQEVYHFIKSDEELSKER